MRTTDRPLYTGSTDQSVARVEALARLMDGAFVIPGTNIRMGLDGLIGFVPFIGLAAVPLQVFAWLVRGVVFQFVGLTGVAAYLRMHFALQSAMVEVHTPSNGFHEVTRA